LTLAYGYVCALCHDAAVRDQRLLKDAEVTAKFDAYKVQQHEATIKAEAVAQALCMTTQDFRRAFEAFAARQKPVFAGN
jgi:hypothetical protein